MCIHLLGFALRGFDVRFGIAWLCRLDVFFDVDWIIDTIEELS